METKSQPWQLKTPGGGSEYLLKGTGKNIRHIVLDTPAKLDEPGVKALMAQALKLAGNPIDKAQPGRIVIKSIAPKQRPRRPQ